VILGLALSPALDVTYEVARLEVGGITRPRVVTRVAGGKTLNAVRAARQLGADAGAVVALGGHSGAEVEELLAGDGVPAEIVRTAGGTRMCITVVEENGGASSTDLYEPSSPLTAPEWERFADVAVEVMVARSAQGPVSAVLSGSLPPGIRPHSVALLLSELRRRGARIVVDSSGEGLRATAPQADLIKINRAEAAELIGSAAPDAASAARAIFALWGRDVVVTDGVRGGAATIDGRARSFRAPRTLGRFPAGSGDAFLGGLLTALETGAGDPLDAARDAAERNARIAGQGVLAPAE
jgi:fructose-1-phosphate kinase PfkB-like protein